jgi:hypothetical protein
LTFEGSGGGGFVDNPVAEQGGAAPVDPSNSSGPSVSGSATLSYSLNRKKYGMSAEYKSLLDYYPQLGSQSTWHRHFLSADVYFTPSSSTRIAIIPAFKNVPELSASDLFDPLLDQGIPLVQDFGLTLARYRRLGLGVEASQRLTNRVLIQGAMNYGHGRVDDGREWDILMGSGTFTYNVTKGMGLFIGYQEGGQRDIVGGVAAPHVRQPRINGGIDFNRPLSLSRRTLVTFATGFAGNTSRTTGETTYYFTGSAQATREFGRTWSAALSYGRGLRQIEPLGDAILSDTVHAGLQGSFSSRVQFHSQVGHSTGHVVSSGDDVTNLFGGVQLSFALNKLFALGADYSYNKFAAATDALGAESLTARNTSSVRTYLELWLPLFTRTKRD